MAITTSEARRGLVPMSKGEYDALVAATVSGRCSERSSLPPVDIREPTLRDEVEGEQRSRLRRPRTRRVRWTDKNRWE
jgi:hypothetical protein